MKKSIMFFCAAIIAVGTSLAGLSTKANEAPASCPTANCNGGNTKCCSNRAGDVWYLR